FLVAKTNCYQILLGLNVALSFRMIIDCKQRTIQLSSDWLAFTRIPWAENEKKEKADSSLSIIALAVSSFLKDNHPAFLHSLSQLKEIDNSVSSNSNNFGTVSPRGAW